MKHNNPSNKYYLYGCEAFRDDILSLINEISNLNTNCGHTPYDVLKYYYLEDHIENTQVELTWPQVIHIVIKHKAINVKSDNKIDTLDDCPF